MLNLFQKDGSMEDRLYIIEGVSNIKYLGKDIYDVIIINPIKSSGEESITRQSFIMPYYKEEIIENLPMWKRLGGVIMSLGWNF